MKHMYNKRSQILKTLFSSSRNLNGFLIARFGRDVTRFPGLDVVGVVLVGALLGNEGDAALSSTSGCGELFSPGSSGALTGCAGGGSALTNSGFKNFRFLR